MVSESFAKAEGEGELAASGAARQPSRRINHD
jgi:hypothetical protein